MATIILLTTEGFKEIETELTFSPYYLPYGKVVVEKDGKYHVGPSVMPHAKKHSLRRREKESKFFWRYVDNLMRYYNQTPLITDMASVFSKHEFVSIISIIEVPVPVGIDPNSSQKQTSIYYGVRPMDIQPIYQPVWRQRFYEAWASFKQQVYSNS
jgi:hypothetical protein